MLLHLYPKYPIFTASKARYFEIAGFELSSIICNFFVRQLLPASASKLSHIYWDLSMLLRDIRVRVTFASNTTFNFLYANCWMHQRKRDEITTIITFLKIKLFILFIHAFHITRPGDKQTLDKKATKQSLSFILNYLWNLKKSYSSASVSYQRS